MNQEEEKNCKGNLIIIYSPRKQKISYVDLKNAKVQMEHFNELLSLAEKGCVQIADTMRQHLLRHIVQKLVTSH